MRSALAGIAVLALVTGGAVSAATQFTPAPHSHPPLLVDHGWSHKPLRLIEFVETTFENAPQLLLFPRALANSEWWDQVSRAYGIPRKITLGGAFSVNDQPRMTSHRTSHVYQNWVDLKARQFGIGADPSHQTLYILFIPCKPPDDLDGYGCAPHHPAIVADQPEFTKLDSLVTVTAPRFTSTDGLTLPASHEIAEAATDTGPTGWFLNTEHPSSPWVDSTAWVEAEGSGMTEAADMSAGDRWYEYSPSLGTFNNYRYEYQRIYSSARSKLNGDPAVPMSRDPYFNVYASHSLLDSGWYRAIPGVVSLIKLNGWSTRRTGDWSVTAKVAAGKPHTSWNSTCKLGRSSWTGINNGTSFTLGLVTSSTSPSPSWCVVRLTSTLQSPPSGGDDYHIWYIGLIIKR